LIIQLKEGKIDSEKLFPFTCYVGYFAPRLQMADFK